MGQSYWALTDTYLLNLNYHFWPNLGSHNMDFWPNAQELVCQQFSSEIYTKFYSIFKPFDLKNINKSDLALGTNLLSIKTP